jgi:DNA mismatch repair protein MutS
VAKMAGMPPSLIDRANGILKQMESKHVDASEENDTGEAFTKNKKNIKENLKQLNAPQMQLSIFDAHSQAFEDIRKILNAVDINRLTPVEALLKLQEIKAMVK